MSSSGSVRRKAMVDLRCAKVRSAARCRTAGRRAVPTAETSDTSIALLLSASGQARMKPSSSEAAQPIAEAIDCPPCVYLATSLVAIACV